LNAPAAAPPGPFAAALSGPRKAAVFILSLEEDEASLLLQNLGDAEAARITAAIESLGVLDPETVAEVLREFFELRRLHGLVREGGLERALRLVERSFPPDKARRIGQFLRSQRKSMPFSFLETVEAETLHACMADEHPQTIALVLAHLPPDKAAGVLDRLEQPARREVVERIAVLDGASAEAIEGLEEALRKQVESARFQSLEEEAGVRAVARILRASGGGGAALLEDLREGRPDLAEEVGRHLDSGETGDVRARRWSGAPA
jgi:flagellar motor switch protein FliG